MTGFALLASLTLSTLTFCPETAQGKPQVYLLLLIPDPRPSVSILTFSTALHLSLQVSPPSKAPSISPALEELILSGLIHPVWP